MMFAEVTQSDGYAEGLSQLVEIERQRRLGQRSHPRVLDWLKANPRSGPTLVFDITRIEQRMQRLRELARPVSISALMAVKSCPDPRYLSAGMKHLDGFDVSNSAEYGCLPDNLDGKLVSVTSPALDVDINSFVAKGNTAVVALDSQEQLARYFSSTPRVPYLLRVQGSDLLEETDPAHYANPRFGFTKHEVRELIEQPQLRANPPAGFHVHHGSERNSASTYRAMIRALRSLAHRHSIDPIVINLGGGWHGVNQEEMDGVLADARRAFPEPCSILLEPGEWYAKQSGFAVGNIVNQTQSDDIITYVLDLSRDCHLKWSKVKLLYPTNTRPKRFCEVQFFGASCDEADRIGRFMLPYDRDFSRESGLVTGARVAFSNVSPYSAAWNMSFNGIPRAEIAWWNDAVSPTW